VLKRYNGKPDDLFEIIKKLQKRVSDLENSPQAAFTTVSRNAFSVKGINSSIQLSTVITPELFAHYTAAGFTISTDDALIVMNPGGDGSYFFQVTLFNPSDGSNSYANGWVDAGKNVFQLLGATQFVTGTSRNTWSASESRFTGRITKGTNDMGGGLVDRGTTFNAVGPIGTTPTQVIQSEFQRFWSQGRAYEITWNIHAAVSVAGAQIAMQIEQGNTGTILMPNEVIATPANTGVVRLHGSWIFTNTSGVSIANDFLKVKLNSNSTNTVTATGTPTLPLWFTVRDIDLDDPYLLWAVSMT
jgi:hypothetical protein